MPSGGNKKPPYHKGPSPRGAKTKHHQNTATTGSKKPAIAGTGSGIAADGTVEDEFNSGFGQYLRSPQAVEMMKLFVIANTVVVFFTMAWPQMQHSFQVIKSLFTGMDEDEL
ncbi:uncharacterized protein LOC129717906 [Wyeomyia smithii]|uniref:uncharacterized protein LOC129717906 n=1 Tax=Wyeomyia smithii TaxID=174621 RepID=UPI002468001C|nr:uncharacterized protein LOC129717906 [Wyeomyia smithii]XP_055524157.1 uncharacterized protein LOC129717906 [Wyeomyia smithii]